MMLESGQTRERTMLMIILFFVLALDTPFLLLPFRPTSDPSAARTFVRNFFGGGIDKTGQLQGERLQQELRLTEPMVSVCGHWMLGLV